MSIIPNARELHIARRMMSHDVGAVAIILAAYRKELLGPIEDVFKRHGFSALTHPALVEIRRALDGGRLGVDPSEAQLYPDG